jgi:hypothetical protein
MRIETSIVQGQIGKTVLRGKPLPAKVMLKQSSPEFRVYVHQDFVRNGVLPSAHLSREFCQFWGVGGGSLQGAVGQVLEEHDRNEIEDLLSEAKIGGYDSHDRDPPSMRQYPTASRRTSHATKKSSRVHVNGDHNNRRGADSHNTELLLSSVHHQALVPTRPRVDEASTDTAAGGTPTVTTPGQDSIEDDQASILGEIKGFKTLQSIFGETLDVSCWTSDLRHHVEGIDPWLGEDDQMICTSFTVHDKHDKMGQWLLKHGIKTPDHWRGQEVLYSIDVKSTTGDTFDPFLMNELQMNLAEYCAAEALVNPKHVFVIFRVFDVASEKPGLEVYCDPWTMMENAKLGYRANQWVVTPTR